MKKAILCGCLALQLNPLALWAESVPRPTALDNRVRTLTYNENEVYKIVASAGYQMDIELADNEEVRTVAAGDTVGWQIVNAGQHLFIKPMAPNARTNLSVVTSRRTYLFDLEAESTRGRAGMTYMVRFKYPSTSGLVMSRPISPGKDPAAFNFDYKVKGAKSLRPRRVFDDGLFTFFQFDDPSRKDLPAIFWVTPDGKESLVNYRMEGAYVVVERVSDKFILRSGDDLATVTNKRRAETELAPNAIDGDGHE